ncbi:MAG: tRNA uridine(34) 5-carboxymethylaminomethyl modification radical SAM/GNAT enzyme Elp3 [Patescibacteria group bacterium]
MEKIILQILKQPHLTAEKLDKIKRQLSAVNHLPPPPTADLLRAYRNLLARKKIRPNLELEKLLIKRRVRSASGVAIVTVLTKPWPCPGQCVYCPSQAGMPKSYLKNEPAAQRAYSTKFDPRKQVLMRLQTLYDNGHPVDKIELIVKGGSWNAYPPSYQVWFIKECFRACNDFQPPLVPPFQGGDKIPPLGKGRLGGVDLQKEQTKNETAGCRIVGLTLETRPDLINPKTIRQMRQLGCTRIELGVQHTDDKILKLCERGHNLQQTKDATRLLRQAGFKLDYHLMPQLPGATPKKDFEMFKKVFADSDLRPDMIKIYPCTVVPDSPLYTWHKQGKYKPYPTKKLVEMLISVKSELIPYSCRISRLIRDIPSTEIVAGNRVTNLREVIQVEMKKRNLKCKCLRCREVGHQELGIKNYALGPKLFIEKYEASGGTEYFLSYEDAKRNIVLAFCRLRIDLVGLYPAYIRELHTYGQVATLKHLNTETLVQHTGFGKKLLAETEKICHGQKISKLAVISGIGVRQYYKKLGYRLEDTYMVKNL